MRKFWFIIIIFISIFMFLNINFSRAQQGQIITDTTTVSADTSKSSNEITNISKINNWIELTELAGAFRWFIFLMLAIGLLLVVYELVILTNDRLHAKPLIILKYSEMAFTELRNIFKNKKKSNLESIGKTLIDIFEKTGSVQGFSEEITNSVKQQEQKFSSFTTTISFLSDTAGALGLLGTVWGMFVTFFSDTWDTTTILRGMGIALVTTLLGLIVSIILNFCSTIVFRIFNKNLSNAITKADELRLALLDQKVDGYIIPEKNSPMHNLKLITKSNTNLTGFVNKQLEEPIKIQAVDQNNDPKPNSIIIFEIVKGENEFTDGNKIQQIKTDENGEATFNFLIGKRSGEYVLHCYSNESQNSTIEFKINAKAGPITKLIKTSKNPVSVQINQKLLNPISIKICDEFSNPIRGHKVTFRLSGSGFLENGQQSIVRQTDIQGNAKVVFQAGSKAEINTVFAIAEGLENAKAEFKIVAVE